MHWKRWRKTGTAPKALGPVKRPAFARWSLDKLMANTTPRLVQPDLGPCLEWNNARNAHGYGVASHGGKLWRCHRLAWRLMFGPIPQGRLVLHECDNPVCLDPAHLSLGTHKKNTRDMMARGRARFNT